MTQDFFSARKVTKSAKNANKRLKSAQKCRKVSKRRDFIVLVLLSVHGERVSVSCMRDLYNLGLVKLGLKDAYKYEQAKTIIVFFLVFFILHFPDCIG